MNGREILVGVCAGVSAYKTADLVSKLVQRGAQVSVVMTENASQFIGASTFAALTNRPVHQLQYAYPEHPLGEHIGLARRAEVVVIAPATANIIAKAANGIADDLLSTLLLVVTSPIFLAPAMNTEMWQKSQVQRNIEYLKSLQQYKVLEPGTGYLSCQIKGPGRMAEPAEILSEIQKFFDGKVN